jgi:hypothetical protein
MHLGEALLTPLKLPKNSKSSMILQGTSENSFNSSIFISNPNYQKAFTATQPKIVTQALITQFRFHSNLSFITPCLDDERIKNFNRNMTNKVSDSHATF